MSTHMVEREPIAATTDEPFMIVSTDTHAGPSAEGQLREYCPSKYLDEFDRYAAEFRASLGGKAKGLVLDVHSAEELAQVKACRGLQDSGARLADMDEHGIAANVIFAGGQNDEPLPFVGAGFGAGHAELSDELRLAGCQIWNRWMADFVAAAPNRLVGVMQIPIHDIEAAVCEVERAANAGVKSVNLPAPRPDFPAYNDPSYDRLWAVCAEAGLPLMTHSAGGEAPLGANGPCGAALFLAEHHWMSRRALWQLIFAGVFERYPGLKLVFAEQRVAWVGQTLAELDSLYFADHPYPRTAKSPSEFWHDNCFLAGSFMAPFEAELRYEIGVRNFMWGDDYPHAEGVWPKTLLSLRHTFAGVPEDEVRLILGENALRVFSLDQEELRRIAARIGPRPDDLSAAPSLEELSERKGKAYRTRGAYS